MSDSDLFLVEATVWDPSVPGLITLRAATGRGYVTLPAETPANTTYDPVLQQPGDLTRDLFAAGRTSGRSRIGFGDIAFLNPDGALDAWLTYGWSGRAVIVRRAPAEPRPAYPGGFTTVFAGTAEQPEASGELLTVTWRDHQLSLEEPLQATKYAGSNVLPTGLEGVAGDIQGTPKPLCFGRVRNVTPVCVNTARLIYQGHDGALAAIAGVYDTGVSLNLLFPLTARTSQFGADGIRAGTTARGLFVLGGVNGKLSTSADGVTFVARTSGFGASTINGLAYGAGLYVAVGQAGKLFTSPDGITWTVRTSQFGASDILAITYGNGIFVAVGAAGKLSTSTDGQTWTAQTTGFGANSISAVAYGAGLFVIGGVGASLPLIQTSPTGVTWTSRTYSGTGADPVTEIAYTLGWFVSFRNSAEEVATSADGITWNIMVPTLLSPVSLLGLTGMPDGSFLGTGSSGGGTIYVGTILAGSSVITWVRQSILGMTGSAYGTIYNEAFGTLVQFGDTGQALSHEGGAAGAYASLADLQDDTLAPAPGTYKTYLAGGYFRLGSTPAGQITADMVEGATAASRTAAQLFARVLTKAGKSAGTGAGQWLAADLTALDLLTTAELGDWIGNVETTPAEVLDRIAATVGAWWGVDLAGRYRIAQFLAPSGTAVAAFTANDLATRPARVAVTDESKGLPSWRTSLHYARNFTVQLESLTGGALELEAGGGIPMGRRAFLTTEWRTVKVEDAAVQTAHLLAAATLEDTLFQEEADALAEATRRQALRGVLRNRWQITPELNAETQIVDLADVITLTHARYGLSAGVLLRVLRVAPDSRARRITFDVWG